MFLINGQDLSTLGADFKKGTFIRELLKPRKPKERFYNNWIEEDGYEFDNISPTKYEAIEYNPTIYLKANNIIHLIERRDYLFSILDDPNGFTITSITMGKDFHLRQIDVNGLVDLTPVWTGSDYICEIQLKWLNNLEKADEYGVLHDDNDNPILDEEGHYIIVKK